MFVKRYRFLWINSICSFFRIISPSKISFEDIEESLNKCCFAGFFLRSDNVFEFEVD